MMEDGLERYRQVRRATEALAAPLSAEDQMVQSMPDASPVKWHLAHTTWFFETFVLQGLEGEPGARPDRALLFNSYYEAVGTRVARAHRGLLSRPSLAEVQAYRRAIDERMARWLEADRLPAERARLVELGLAHEEQHQELILTDIKHALFANPLAPAYTEAPAGDPAGRGRPLVWRRHEERIAWIGHDGAGFSFDNERPRHRALVAGFELASRLVTADEYLEFIRDGGYRRATLWLSDGWAEVQASGWQAPLYWGEEEGGWCVYTLRGRRPLDPGEPVCHLSYYEADAYARWAGARLPTELEWEVAAGEPGTEGAFLESGALHPTAAGGEGPAQLFGDCWEWTASAYAPYPGFRPEEGAAGEYNGKFMSGQMVLRGGSCATPRSHIRATYRNFFPPGARWQFSGVRLARDL
jgi:ergothioneine biosynthesis protein EgtB